MTVQDDERERELVRLFNLSWDPAHQRAGVDAVLSLPWEGRDHELEVEVKSTTGDTVSTARDVGMEHIAKWRRKLFVIGFYSREARRPELQRCLCLTPADMAPWIDSIESKIAIDFAIAERSAGALGVDDVEAVCGVKPHYSMADARGVLKQQWSKLEYLSAADFEVEGEPCFTARAMLQIVRLRAAYIARRGATLNNPHITKTHLAAFFGTSREVDGDWAHRIRSLGQQWLGQSASNRADPTA